MTSGMLWNLFYVSENRKKTSFWVKICRNSVSVWTRKTDFETLKVWTFIPITWCQIAERVIICRQLIGQPFYIVTVTSLPVALACSCHIHVLFAFPCERMYYWKRRRSVAVAWDASEMCCSVSDGTASIRVRAGTWCIHTQCVPRVSFPTSLQQSAPPSLLSPVLTLLHLFPITPVYRPPCFPSFMFQIALFFSDITSVPSLPCVFVPSLVYDLLDSDWIDPNLRFGF